MSGHPTGSVPTNLPIWEELDAAGVEEYCTAFLNGNPVIRCRRGGNPVDVKILSALRQLTSRPQYGADLLAKTDNGEQWLFQCKRVQRFGPGAVSEAAEEAEARSPMKDQYVLVVTCGLSADAQRELDARPKWMAWDASRLTTETAKLSPRTGIPLVQRFFGKDWVKRLFPWGDQPFQTWEDFFGRDLSEDRTHFHHRAPYVPMGGVLDDLEAFARNEAAGALVLSAAGGQGKSRLLLELARRLDNSTPRVEVRFLNQGLRCLAEDQTDLLGREENLLLVVDDAHRLDAVLGDVARAAATAKNIRLLVATRPHATEAVRGVLFRSGYEERLAGPATIGRWTKADIGKLAGQILGPRHHPVVDRLATLADRCPLLVVIGGGLIKAGALPDAMTGHGTFRERVFKGFREDFLANQPASNRQRMDRLIQLLSLVSPTPVGDLLYDKASRIIGCQPRDVEEDLGRLDRAGLVVTNREGVRLYPDLFADAVLLDACLGPSHRPSVFIRDALARLSFTDFPAVLRNIAQADWETRSKMGARGSLFDPIWQEFVRCFGTAVWRDPRANLANLMPPALAQRPAPRRPHRDDLLGAWASSAVYLPERTLDLAEMAIRSAGTCPTPTPPSPAGYDIRPQLAAALTPLLLPISISRPDHAARALDLLWSLDTTGPASGGRPAENPISAIAEAGSFVTPEGKGASGQVIGWLEGKLREPGAIDRLRREPWLLSALLKPFLARTMESVWITGSTITSRVSPVNIEATRGLRGRALALAERFICDADEPLASTAVPVLRRAINRMSGSFPPEPSAGPIALWQPERLEALSVLGRAISAQAKSPLLLFQIRRLLLACAKHELDPEVVRRCEDLLAQVPDSFELRVVRALGSWAHDEIKPQKRPAEEAGAAETAGRWRDFCREVAEEVVERHADAGSFCVFLGTWARALAGVGLPAQAHALIEPAAALSNIWCGELLDVMVGSRDPTLDPCLWAILLRARRDAPAHYLRALQVVAAGGRVGQACALVSFLGTQASQPDGLGQAERHALQELARRTDEEVVRAVATCSGLGLGREPVWALNLLCGLKPAGEDGQAAILEALGQLVELHGTALDGDLVARCLKLLGDYPARHINERHELQLLAEKFPKQLYECLRDLLDHASGPASSLAAARLFNESIPFGDFQDESYLAGETQGQWRKALSAAGSALDHLFLAHSLIWSAPDRAPALLARFIGESTTPEQLKWVAKLVAPQGSGSVLGLPELVRELLSRGKQLGVATEVHRTLWLAACGGPRGYTDGHLDPEFRYVSERAQDLSRRFASDPVLARFYGGIVASERLSQAQCQERWQEEQAEL